MQRQLRFLQFLRRTLPSLIKKFAYTFSIKAGRTKVLPVLFYYFSAEGCKAAFNNRPLCG